jgi:uncharacterized protein (TIGR00369 family)
MAASAITAEEFKELLRVGLPAGAAMPFEVVELEHGLAVLRLTTGPADLRPGGTVAGPVLFAIADLAMYAAVLSAIGKVPLAVTTDATIHFLRRPRAGVLRARARLIKEGQRLIVGEVTIGHEREVTIGHDGEVAIGHGGDDDAPVAHLVMSYSVPAAR